MLRVAGYVRVSSDEQVKGTSPSFQSDRIEKWCEMLTEEYTLDIFKDLGYSGKLTDRPSLQDMLDCVQRGEYDVVIVWKLDRLARNLVLLLNIKGIMDSCGVRFVSFTESVDTSTTYGKMMFNILGVVAEWERELIVERVKAGRQSKYKSGKWHSGRTPFGYDFDKEKKTLAVNDAEATLVRRIFNYYVNDRMTMEEIGIKLTDETKSGPRGRSRAWFGSVIRRIIVRRAYIGELEINRHNADADDRSDDDVEDSDRPSTIPVPAIVDRAIWERAQDLRAARFHVPGPRREPWLLQQRIRCGLGTDTCSKRKGRTARTESADITPATDARRPLISA